jgi:hypothetical protein
MASNKNDLLGSIGIANQEALVKFLQKPKVPQSVKKVIPGGKFLLQQIDKEHMVSAVYNWLRTTRAFTTFTLSWAREPELFKLKSTKVRTFDTDQPKEIWETHPEGRRYLAKELADIINKEKFVKLEVRKDGIYMFTDVEKKFAALRKVTAEDLKILQAQVAEAKAKAEASGKAFVEPTLPELDSWIPTEEWEPFIEFTPKDKPEFGR